MGSTFFGLNGPDTFISIKSTTYNGVRNPDCNVRSFTQSVNKKTYVPGAEHYLPDDFLDSLNSEDRQMLTVQMASLPEVTAKALGGMLREQLNRGRLGNPAGWLFSMLRRARNGELKLSDETTKSGTAGGSARLPETRKIPQANLPIMPASRPSQEQVRAMIASIRRKVSN